MFFFPYSGTFQLPSVNDISIQNQAIAFVIFKEVGNLFRSGSGSSEMNIGENNCSVVRFLQTICVLQIFIAQMNWILSRDYSIMIIVVNEC